MKNAVILQRQNIKMKLLVVGSGGREHSLCWALSGSPLCEVIYCAPGHAGIAEVAECVDISQDDIDSLVNFTEKKCSNFVVWKSFNFSFSNRNNASSQGCKRS